MGTNKKKRKRESTQKAKIQLKDMEQITEKKSKMDPVSSNQQKKIWSFDTLVEAMEPSTEELDYRKAKLRESGFLQKYSQLFKCTKCQLNIKPLIVKHEKVPTHPCLGVLMCENCCNYYQDGEFSLDSDGEDKYCRWCGEGGTIFSCSNCICGFCTTCIKQHFETDYLKQVQKDENWLCFFCNPKPLWDQRFICYLATQLSENVDLAVSSSSLIMNKEELCKNIEDFGSEQSTTDSQKNTKTENKIFKRKKISKTKKQGTRENLSDLKNSISKSKGMEEKKSICVSTSSSDESDLDRPKKKVMHTSTPLSDLLDSNETNSFESIKDNVLSELKNILSLSEHKMSFGVTWSNNMVEKLSRPEHITTHSRLIKECQNIKRVLLAMSAYLNQISKSVDSIEKTLCAGDGGKVQDFPSKDQSAYINILQFLGFIRGQVKTFMEKGISFSDVFEAEIYDDERVIGLKKKLSSSIVTSNQSRSEIISENNFNSNNDDSTGNKEYMDQEKVNELSRNRDDSTFDMAVDLVKEKDYSYSEDKDEYKGNELAEQAIVKDCMHKEDEEEYKDNDSSNTTFAELNELKSADPKDDIREILAILENA